MTRKAAPMMWSKFSWEAYENDRALKLCSLAAQGLWMRILCLMHQNPVHGHLDCSLDELSIFIGRSAAELGPLVEELERRQVFSRRGDLDADPEFQEMIGQIEACGTSMQAGSHTVVNRRMVRDYCLYVVGHHNGLRGGNPSLTGRKPPGYPGGLTPPVIPSPYPQGLSLEVREDRRVEDKDASHPDASASGASKPQQIDLLTGEPSVPSPRAALLGEGVELMAGLLKLPLPGERDRTVHLLLKMLRDAGGDAAILLDVIRDAHGNPPRDPIPWIVGCVSQRKGKPRLVVVNDPNDSWGIQGWCQARQFARTQSENDQKAGKWIAKIGDRTKIIDRTASVLARAAKLPRSWRGDWDVLLDWIRAGLQTEAILKAVERSASRDGYDPSMVRSLAYFNVVVGFNREAAA